MNKIITLIALLIACISYSQAPSGFNYQSVVRDASGNLIANTTIGVEFQLHQITATGTVLYTETHMPTTNDYGLFSLVVGQGTTTDDFSTIGWSSDSYFLETSIDISGGTTYISMGTTQLLSVPFAMHAASAVEVDGDTTNELNNTVVLNGTDLEVTDAGGTLVTDLSTLKLIDELTDADGDTKIQLEETSDEDIIRFDTNGTEYFTMDNGRLAIKNIGNSIFIGENAGINDDLSNNRNVFIGSNAGITNSVGHQNIAIGSDALENNTTGYQNVAIGTYALENNTTGLQQVAIGTNALQFNTTGSNLAIGVNALQYNTTGHQNTAIGLYSQEDAVDLIGNVSLGAFTLYEHTTSNYNTVVGYYAMGQTSDLSFGNVAIGKFAGQKATGGSKNVLVGTNTGLNISGSNNVALGSQAGSSVAGDNSVFLGHQSGQNETLGDRLYIENSNSSTPLIYGEFDNDLIRINGSFETTNTVSSGGNLLLNGNWLTNDGDNEGIYVSGNGNVGIGNSNPQSSLDIISASGTARIELTPAAGSNSRLLFNNDGGTALWNFGANTSQNLIFLDSQNGKTPFTIEPGVNNDDTLYLNSEGFVGVNNNAPTVALDVTGDIALDGIIDFTNSNANVIMGGFSNSETLDNLTGNNVIIGNQAAETALSGSGNVVIGSSAGAVLQSNNNIIIGNGAGAFASESERLYIGSSPLIYGEFDDQLVRVNGELQSTKEVIIDQDKDNLKAVGAEDAMEIVAFGMASDGTVLNNNTGTTGISNVNITKSGDTYTIDITALDFDSFPVVNITALNSTATRNPVLTVLTTDTISFVVRNHSGDKKSDSTCLISIIGTRDQ